MKVVVDLELKTKRVMKALNRTFTDAKDKCWTLVKPALLWLVEAIDFWLRPHSSRAAAEGHGIFRHAAAGLL
jgi:hypothetical protein